MTSMTIGGVALWEDIVRRHQPKERVKSASALRPRPANPVDLGVENSVPDT